MERGEKSEEERQTRAFEEQKNYILYELVMGIKRLMERESTALNKLLTENFFTRMRMLLVDRERNVRETAMRICRYTAITPQAFQIMLLKNIPLFIAICLEREEKSSLVMERFMAFKFILHWIKSSPENFPIIFVQSLVTIGNSNELNMKNSALDTLCSVAQSTPNLLASCGGIKLLIESILIPDPAFANTSTKLLLVLLDLISNPQTRAYLRPFVDIERLLAIFIQPDTSGKELKREELEKLEAKLVLAKRAIVNLLRSWSGLIYLTADPNGLESLVQALDQPVRMEIRGAIFDIFLEVLSGSNGNYEPTTSNGYQYINSNTQTDNLHSTYQVILLQAFAHSGIYDVLIRLATSTEIEIALKAVHMLRRLMQLSACLTPNVPQFPKLIEMAADFSGEDNPQRVRASQVIRLLGDSNNILLRPVAPSKDKKSEGASYCLKSLVQISQMPLGVPYTKDTKSIWGNLKEQIAAEADENKFSHMLRLSGVTASKDFLKWDWKQINDILEMTIIQPQKLRDALKTKFVKRLLAFYSPSKGTDKEKFINKIWCQENFIYSRGGYNLLKGLLAIKDGRYALSIAASDALFRQRPSFLQELADHLEMEVKHTLNPNTKDIQRIFTKERLLGRMAREYLSWIGLFTSTKHGLRMLQQFVIFESLKKIVEPSGQNDVLCMLIVNAMDYRISEDTRNILQLWMEKGSPQLGLYILDHLRILFRSGLANFSQWCIDILVTQMYSDNHTIAEKAVNVLKEVCESEEVMHAVVKTWPQLDKLELGGDSFIARFLRTDFGFKYLNELNWIEFALKRWKTKGNEEYAIIVSELLNSEILKESESSKESGLQILIPPELNLTYAYDLKIFKRLPLGIHVSIENSFGDVKFNQHLLTYPQLLEEEKSGVILVGKLINKRGGAEPFKFETHFTIKAALTLGLKNIDPWGRDILDPLWISCDFNDRKTATFWQGTHLVVQKSGVTFRFLQKEGEGLLLDDVLFEVEFTPRQNSITKERSMPNHLMGELGRTEEGLNLLTKSEYIQQFVSELRDNSLPLLTRRASLWAIGHIASSQRGFTVIKQFNVIQDIAMLAQTSTHLPLRGECLAVMGLISKSQEGKKMLGAMGWECHPSSTLGIAYPKDPSILFSIPGYQYEGSIAHFQEVTAIFDNINAKYKMIEEKKIFIEHIGNLSSLITQKKVFTELKKMTLKNPDIIMSVDVFHCVATMLKYYNFPLHIRRYIIKLFEKLIFSNNFLYNYENLINLMQLPIPNL